MKTPTPLFDRRSLLTGAAAALGLAGLGRPLRAALPAAPSPPRPPRGRIVRPLANAEAADWLAVVGTYFGVQTEVGFVTLRLVAVEALPADPHRPSSLARSRGFLAKFVPIGRAFPAGDRIYPLSSVGLRPMDVYFSPMGNTLTAVFN